MHKNSTNQSRREYNTGTKDLLLDSAERLISRNGYGAVTLSAIAADAGCNVGQIVYHFGTKEAFLRACILRRAKVLSDERVSLLNNYVQLVGKENVQIEPLIRAFVDPFFDKVLGGDEGWHDYVRLLVNMVWRENATDFISEGYDEVAIMYLESFRDALPGLTSDGAVRGFQFLLAALYSSVSDDRRIEILTHGSSTAMNYKAYYDLLVPFLAAGITRISEVTDQHPKSNYSLTSSIGNLSGSIRTLRRQ